MQRGCGYYIMKYDVGCEKSGMKNKIKKRNEEKLHGAIAGRKVLWFSL